MSGSLSSSSVSVICAATSLYSRNASTSGCISETAFEWARNFALSAWTAGSPISAAICSYLLSSDVSLSNMIIPDSMIPDPPETGGRNATSSPSFSAAVSRAYSSFTAHEMLRACSRSSPGTPRPAPATRRIALDARRAPARVSSEAPASSRSRANSRIVTCTRAPAPPAARPRPRDPPSPPRSRPRRPRSARASRSARSA